MLQKEGREAEERFLGPRGSGVHIPCSCKSTSGFDGALGLFSGDLEKFNAGMIGFW